MNHIKLNRSNLQFINKLKEDFSIVEKNGIKNILSLFKNLKMKK